jgi:hypothetical protein
MSCHTGVTIVLHGHPFVLAARVLREGGATPAQLKAGIRPAVGKTKQAIAGERGVQLSSVAGQAESVYQALDVRTTAGLGAEIWLGQG